MPLSSSFVWAIAPCRLACELLSWAMSCFWSAIRRASARCCAWASASSSPRTGPGLAAGEASMPTRKGIDRRAMRRRDRRSVRDRGKRWVVAWRVNEQASSSRASVPCQALRPGLRSAEQIHARRIWHRLRGHSRDDRFPASGQCTSVGNPLPSVACAGLARVSALRHRGPPSGPPSASPGRGIRSWRCIGVEHLRRGSSPPAERRPRSARTGMHPPVSTGAMSRRLWPSIRPRMHATFGATRGGYHSCHE